jgi:pimeloyl-ACP methyl ester carboxylesterase
MNITQQPGTLRRSDGIVAYECGGTGRLVVCAPGMGDLRASYRHLAPTLTAAGYRVAVTDLRGHGDSSAAFSAYGDEPTADDIAALIEHLSGPAIIVGNSMAAGSAVLVAAQHPELVSALVLIGPFVRDHGSPLARIVTRGLMASWWAAAAWGSYLPTLYAGTKPPDFDDYRKQVTAALRRPGHAAAFSRTTRTRHTAAAASLSRVNTPTLVIMGELDPDFPKPHAEAQWIADQLHGKALLIPDAGHYPQSQQPELVSRAVLRFLATISAST